MTEMPDFPARGSMDWRDELKTYVDSIRTRGGAELIDATTMGRSVDDVGSYAVRADNIVDGPPIEGNPVVAFEALRGAANGVLQRVTSGVSMWWRYSASSSSWGAWQEVALGQGIERVIFDPAEYFPNGVAAVVDNRHTAMDLGDSLDGFTPYAQDQPERWLTYTPAPTFDGGGQIQFEPNERGILRWDQHGTFTDGEVLIRANVAVVSLVSAQGGAVLRGGNGYERGYLAHIRGAEGGQMVLRITRYNPVGGEGSAANVLGSADITVADSQPYYIRFRADGDELRAKFWLTSDSEPDEWTLSVTDSEYASGFAGIGKLSGASVNRWNYIAVNRKGGTA